MSNTELQTQVDELEKRLSHTDAKLRSKLDYLLKEVQNCEFVGITLPFPRPAAKRSVTKLFFGVLWIFY